MTNGWPMVPLREIAAPVARPVAVTPGQTYRTIGVKWWGEGAYERQTIDGSQTAAKTLSLVQESDLIINKIWVRHGSRARPRLPVIVAFVSRPSEACYSTAEILSPFR